LYSSDDPDVELVFKYAGQWMGSEVTVSSGSHTFNISVWDNEPIDRVELISNTGAVRMAVDLPDGPTQVAWQPSVVVQSDAFFFVKVTGTDRRQDDDSDDKQVVVSAPIWLNIN
jgi:hypothetical protein